MRLLGRKSKLDEDGLADEKTTQGAMRLALACFSEIPAFICDSKTSALAFRDRLDDVMQRKGDYDGALDYEADLVIRADNDLVRRHSFAMCVNSCKTKSFLRRLLAAALNRARMDAAFIARCEPPKYNLSKSRLFGDTDNEEADEAGDDDRRSKTVVRSVDDVLNSRARWGDSRIRIIQAEKDFEDLRLSKAMSLFCEFSLDFVQSCDRNTNLFGATT